MTPHELPTPFGSLVMATGAVGEFGPIIAVAVLLSGNSAGRTAVILGAYAVITAIAIGGAHAAASKPG